MPALQCVSYSIVIALVAAIGVGSGPAHAQNSYPDKPVRIVTGGAGSQTHMLVRSIAHKLSERSSQPVVIANAGKALAASVPGDERDGSFGMGAPDDQTSTFTNVAELVGPSSR